MQKYIVEVHKNAKTTWTTWVTVEAENSPKAALEAFKIAVEKEPEVSPSAFSVDRVYPVSKNSKLT